MRLEGELYQDRWGLPWVTGVSEAGWVVVESNVGWVVVVGRGLIHGRRAARRRLIIRTGW